MRMSVRGRSTVSSKTRTTPEPSVVPASRAPSKVSGRSSSSGRDEASRGAAEQHGLQRAAAGDAAGELEQLGQGRRRTGPRRRPGAAT